MNLSLVLKNFSATCQVSSMSIKQQFFFVTSKKSNWNKMSSPTQIGSVTLNANYQTVLEASEKKDCTQHAVI